MKYRFLVPVCALLVVALGSPVFVSQQATPTRDPLAPDYKSNLPADHPAIQYGRGAIDDAAARLAQQLERGTLTLEAQPGAVGVLPELLRHLKIDPDSQMLVFSKTSFQAARISPRVPRAIYFGDDAIVAYVPGAPTLEIVAIDPVQGPMFYSMPVATAGKPALAHGQTCLRCHQGPNTAGVPGIYVGSVIPRPTGAPLRDDTAIVTDHRSPFAERWGGWYVTARRGEQRDRANAVASNPADPETLVRDAQQNLSTLIGRFDQSAYLAGSSDIVALMTFEHQTQMTNLFTRVAWDARIGRGAGLQRRWEERHQTDGRSAGLQARPEPSQSDGRSEGIQPQPRPEGVQRNDRGADVQVRRDTPGEVGADTLDEDIEDLIRYMLFAGEAPLKDPIEGVSTFTRTFPQRGPRDARGRSLRDFDLKTRLFRYPLSYLVYSAQFDALPDAVRDRIYRRLYDVLTGSDPAAARFVHLSGSDRRAIVEILRDTKPDLPEYWRTDTF